MADLKKTMAVADPNGPDIHNQTQLHVAAPYGHTDVVHVLLGRAADPNRLNGLGKKKTHCIRVSSSIRCTKYVNDNITIGERYRAYGPLYTI